MNGASNKGFTLVELLIALVLTGLVMVLLFASLRIGSRSWETVDTRQEQVSEQYQLQQFLRRLVAKAKDEKVRSTGGSVQVAFKGESGELIFVAPSKLGDQSSGLLWYRLYLSEATAEHPKALMLETTKFDQRRGIDWTLLFEPDVYFDQYGEEIEPPKQHVLGLTGDAELHFSYHYYDENDLAQESDIWEEESQLPRLIEIGLERHEARDSTDIEEPGIAGWSGLNIALAEYNYAVRTD